MRKQRVYLFIYFFAVKHLNSLFRRSRSLLNERTMENALRMASVLVALFEFLRTVTRESVNTFRN